MVKNSKLQIAVNPQMELLMVVLLTSNYPDLCRQFLGYSVMTEEKTEYIEKVNQYFSPYAKHPIYDLLDEMMPKGFALGAPVEAALSLGIPPQLEKVRPYSQFAIQRAYGEDKLNEFVELLRDFALETNFMEFYHKNLKYYSDALDLFINVTNQLPYIEILEDFYGFEQESYNIYLTQLSRVSYGLSLKNDNDKLDIYNICGYNSSMFQDKNTFSQYLSNLIWHEFSHAIINPLTEKYDDLVKEYEYTYDYLKQYKQPNAGYDPWDECINEHIIRGIAIYLCQEYMDKESAKDRLTYDVNLGYIYIPKIIEKLEYYNQNRNTYMNIEDFYKELLSVFSQRV